MRVHVSDAYYPTLASSVPLAFILKTMCMETCKCLFSVSLWSLLTSFVQGLLTSGYIILLSRVGERVAADMRKTLFASLLRYVLLNAGAKESMDTAKAMIARQDAVVFTLVGNYEAHVWSRTSFVNVVGVVVSVSGKMWLSLMPIKLGSWWIVWLLTFRSSSHPLNWWSRRYKALYLYLTIIVKCFSCSLVIPVFCLFAYLQGLRSITQTFGCLVSLYIISPKLTGLTVVVLPCLVGGGALIGSFLRKLSRLAQEQVMHIVVL